MDVCSSLEKVLSGDVATLCGNLSVNNYHDYYGGSQLYPDDDLPGYII